MSIQTSPDQREFWRQAIAKVEARGGKLTVQDRVMEALLADLEETLALLTQAEQERDLLTAQCRDLAEPAGHPLGYRSEDALKTELAWAKSAAWKTMQERDAALARATQAEQTLVRVIQERDEAKSLAYGARQERDAAVARAQRAEAAAEKLASRIVWMQSLPVKEPAPTALDPRPITYWLDFAYQGKHPANPRAERAEAAAERLATWMTAGQAGQAGAIKIVMDAAYQGAPPEHIDTREGGGSHAE